MNNSLQLLIEKHIPNLKAYGFQLVVLLEQEPPDFEAIKSLAHMIKGSTASLGFQNFTDLCAHIEAESRGVIEGRLCEFDDQSLFELKAIVQGLTAKQSELFDKVG